MKLLLLVGAGASVELGVPGMDGLARSFLQHSKEWNVHPGLVTQLMGETTDIEVIIEKLDLICGASEALASIGQQPAAASQADAVRAELEWFVQHMAERVSSVDARLQWGGVLRSRDLHDLSFVTTNYDRAIELAANAEHVALDDGFASFSDQETAAWGGFVPTTPGLCRYVKLHGSTDWYSDITTSQPIRLRHPMPLFGRACLRLQSGRELGRSLVLPSQEKLLTRAPYPRLSHAFLQATDESDCVIVVGSSLRDGHLRDAVGAAAGSRPVYVVNPDGDHRGVAGARGIAQYASHFLVSTLPLALRESDPLVVLNAASSQRSASSPILEWLRVALDSGDTCKRRCEAIESLYALGVTPDASLLTELCLTEDVTVARYSLGLVAASPDRDELLQAISGCGHCADRDYSEELALLTGLVSAS